MLRMRVALRTLAQTKVPTARWVMLPARTPAPLVRVPPAKALSPIAATGAALVIAGCSGSFCACGEKQTHEQCRHNVIKDRPADWTVIAPQSLDFVVSARILSDDNYTNISDATSSDDAKVVHFIRHGMTFKGKDVFDPMLNDEGKEQAERLYSMVRKKQLQPQLLVVAPNQRTMQTGVLAFKDQPLKIVARTDVQSFCRRHAVDFLQDSTQLHPVEYWLIDFEGTYEETEEERMLIGKTKPDYGALAQRNADFLQWLKGRDEKHVAVCMSGEIMLTLFNAVLTIEGAKAPCPLCKEQRGVETELEFGEMRSFRLTFTPK